MNARQAESHDSLKVFGRRRIPLGDARMFPVRQKVLVLQLPRAAHRRVGRRPASSHCSLTSAAGRRSTVRTDLGPRRLEASARGRHRRQDRRNSRDGRRCIVLILAGSARLQQAGRCLLGLARIQNGAVDVAAKQRRRRAA